MNKVVKGESEAAKLRLDRRSPNTIVNCNKYREKIMELFEHPEDLPVFSGGGEQENIFLVDTHCHIDGAEYDRDREEMIARAGRAGVKLLVNMSDSLESSQRSVKLAAHYANVYTGVGVHPEEAFSFTPADDDRLAAWTKEPRVVAIGEIGLDYYWEKDQDRRQLQKDIFIRQLALARDLDLPVCIHDREAHGDILQILQTEGKGNRGVVHCFSGSVEMARELLKLGWYLGVDGPVTYKNAKKGLDVVREIPLDRLLLETDSPYLTPHPYRGRRNEPGLVRLVAEKVAELREIPLAELAAQTTRNARDVYGL